MGKNNSGMLKNRKAGNYTPDNAYDDSDIKSKDVPVNHRKNVKISVEQKKYLEAVKHINGLSYDYEAIELLINRYIDNESETNKQRISRFMEL